MPSIISFFKRNLNKTIFSLFAIFIVLCFSVTLYEKTQATTAAYPNEIPCYLVSDSIVDTSIDVIPKYPVSAISIMFGTYTRANEGTLHICLYEDSNILQEWNFSTMSLTDNGYQTLIFDEEYTFSETSHYHFTIVNRYVGENAVALWQTKEGKGCYTLTFTSPFPWKTLLGFTAFILIISLMVIRGAKEWTAMSVMLTFATFLFWRTIPLNGVPDEQAHFLRSYEIANYSLVSHHVGDNNRGGHIMHWGLHHYNDKTVNINKESTDIYEFSGASLYSPISYLPQAIGIKVTGWVTQKVYKIYKGGRAANALISLVISILALYFMPFGRKIMFTIMLMPMTMQEMVSMAPDSLVNSLSMLWIAYILNLAYTDRKITRKTIAIIATMGITLAMLKIIYIVLLLTLLILPSEKFPNKRHYFYTGGLIAISALILNLIWLKISSQFLIEYNPGVNSSSQIMNILTSPFNYFSTIIYTTMTYAEFYVKSGTGTCLGWLNMMTSPYVWISILLALTYETLRCNETPANIKTKDIVLLFTCCFTCILLIYTSLYVQWTPVNNNIVNGVQGRYFLPLLLYFAVAIAMVHRRRNDTYHLPQLEKNQASYIYLILALCAADAFMTI